MRLITFIQFSFKNRRQGEGEGPYSHKIGIRSNVVYGWSLLCLSVGGLSSMGNLNGSHDNKVPRKKT